MTDTSRVVQEREYHDHFYEADSIRIAESHMYRALDERMIDLLIRRGSTPGARVLSVGSGDGRLEVRAASQLAELVGYELSPVAVERARARAAEAGSANAHFEVGEIGKLRLPAQFAGLWAFFGASWHAPMSNITARRNGSWTSAGYVSSFGTRDSKGSKAIPRITLHHHWHG